MSQIDLMLDRGPQKPDREEVADIQRRWALARRNDLADAFGIAFSVPIHGRGEEGVWKYGLREPGGMASRELTEAFDDDVTQIVRHAAADLVSKGVITEEDADSLHAQPYSVGPAAQEWPKILFDLYQHARPFLNDGASLLAWGACIHAVIRGVRQWASKTERQVYGASEDQAASYTGSSVMPGMFFTRPALTALCYADVVERYGVSQSVTIDSHSRPLTTYATVDHPGGQETYLIRFKTGRKSYFYHANGTGVVSEHYLLSGSSIALLPLPDFLGDEYQASSRAPGPAQVLEVRVGDNG